SPPFPYTTLFRSRVGRGRSPCRHRRPGAHPSPNQRDPCPRIRNPPNRFRDRWSRGVCESTCSGSLATSVRLLCCALPEVLQCALIGGEEVWDPAGRCSVDHRPSVKRAALPLESSPRVAGQYDRPSCAAVCCL